MLAKLWAIWSIIRGKNSALTPKDVIVDQMNEPRPLPLGSQEFEEWSDRIISGSMLSADADSQKFALANEIMSLGPTEDFKPDAYFIHKLRKFACNQVADSKRGEIRDRVKARLAAEEAAKQAAEAAAQTSTAVSVQDDANNQQGEAMPITVGVADESK